MSLSLNLEKRCSKGLSSAETVVLRGLPLDASLKEVQDCLGSLRPLAIEFYQDEAGQFHGTVFVKLASKEEADSLVYSGCELQGRRIKAEIAHSPRSSRKLSVASPKGSRVSQLIESFVASEDHECLLPASLSQEERLLAHSIAERYGLTHVTRAPWGESLDSSKQRSVLLSKSRSSPSGRVSRTSFKSIDKQSSRLGPPPGLSAPKRLSVDAPIFTPIHDILASRFSEPVQLPNWLVEQPNTSLVLNDALFDKKKPKM